MAPIPNARVATLLWLALALSCSSTSTNEPAGTGGAGGGGASGGSSGSAGAGPRKILCANKTCSGSEDCCGDVTWGQTSCAAPGSCGTPYELACDDKADCTSGDVCCGAEDGASPGKLASSYCGKSCLSGEKQLCSSSGECLDQSMSCRNDVFINPSWSKGCAP